MDEEEIHTIGILCSSCGGGFVPIPPIAWFTDELAGLSRIIGSNVVTGFTSAYKSFAPRLLADPVFFCKSVLRKLSNEFFTGHLHGMTVSMYQRPMSVQKLQ